MTNNDLVRLYMGLESVKKMKGVKFSYGVSKNKKKIQPDIEALQESTTPSEKFKEYDQKRVALCEKYSVKENGKPVMEENNYIIENQAEFDKDILALKEEYNEEIAAHNVKEIEFQKLLSLDIQPIDFHKISVDDLPEDITPEIMENISEIIE